MGNAQSNHAVTIKGGSDRGLLYGVFFLLQEVGIQQQIPAVYRSGPSAPIRWVDEWDNLNGTIERGYAGRSIFFENGMSSRTLHVPVSTRGCSHLLASTDAMSTT